MESWLCFWKLTRSFRINSILRCHARKMVKLLQSLPIDGLEAFLYEPWLSLWATAMLSLENLFFTLAPASFAKYCPCEVSPFFFMISSDGNDGNSVFGSAFNLLEPCRSVKRVDTAELPQLVTELCCGPWSDPICILICTSWWRYCR